MHELLRRRRVVTMLVVLGVLSVPGARPLLAGDNHAGAGSAIVPMFHLESAALLPGEDATLLGCVSQSNRHSGRALETGDAFALEFADGSVGPCHGVTTSGFGVVELAAGDFTCETNGLSVTITYNGPTRDWPFGATTCVRVPFHAPAVPVPVATSYRVGTTGAFAPAEPSLLMLSVAEGVRQPGPPGPAGPAGPPGPQGPPGTAGTGEVLSLRSTEPISASARDWAVVVPGLDGTISVRDGSRVLVVLDAVGYFDCWSTSGTSWVPSDGEAWLEVDGTVVGRRKIGWGSTSTGTNDGDARLISWMVPPGPPRTITVRALINCRGSGINARSGCLGDYPGGEFEARIQAIELPR